MHVLLVRPKSLSMISNIDVINLEPLELEYLYTIALEEKVKCQILDCLFDKRDFKDILKEFNPDLVVIGGYITQEAMMIEYSKIVKSYNPSIKVMIGGVHAQVNYERFYTDTIDYIVHSSSLEPFRQILRWGTVLQNKGLKDIDGICYREDHAWLVNKKRSINPDELPIPDRSHFNANKHLYRYLGFSPCAIVKTAFSCPYGCNFCFCRKINDGQYVARKIDLVVEEIEGITCDTIHIVDDTFLISRERVHRFIALIKEKNIKKSFIFYSRADFVVENETLIKALASIGTKGIIVGLEAVCDGELDAYSKQTSEDVNKQCIKVIQKYDIECLALFIVDIHATKMDFDNLYKWIATMGLKYASVSIFTPIPGTTLFEQYKDKLTTEKMQYWDFLHLVLEPTNMSRKSFYLEYYKLFLKLSLLGKKGGVYDFVDMQYIKNTAKTFFRSLVKGL